MSRKILPNKPDGNEMVAHELVVVLPWFLETEKKNQELLGPERCLHEVVALELGLQLPVRITYDMRSAVRKSRPPRVLASPIQKLLVLYQ
jgi:hypothetical protein